MEQSIYSIVNQLNDLMKYYKDRLEKRKGRHTNATKSAESLAYSLINQMNNSRCKILFSSDMELCDTPRSGGCRIWLLSKQLEPTYVKIKNVGKS